MTDNTPPVPPAGSNQPYGQNPQAPQYSAPQQQAPAYGAPAYGQPGQTNPKWNVLSIITLVSAIIGFSLISIVLGIISLNQIKKTGEQGKILAIIGIIIGALYTLLYIFLIIVTIAAINAGLSYETY